MANGPKLEQVQTAEEDLTIDGNTVMTGFCYNFTLTLLNALIDLWNKDQVYEKGLGRAEEAEQSDGQDSKHTNMTEQIYEMLNAQLGRIFDGDKWCSLPTELSSEIQVAKKFLTIFKKPPNQKD